MNINAINSGVSFSARLSDSVKDHLTNKGFQRQLEDEISACETLKKFDAPDNEIVLQAVRKHDGWGDSAVWPQTILKGSINGVPVEAELDYSLFRIGVWDRYTYLKDLNSDKEYQQIALGDIEGAQGKEWHIKSQMVRDYVRKAMGNLTGEQAAKLYDKIVNGEFKL